LEYLEAQPKVAFVVFGENEIAAAISSHILNKFKQLATEAGSEASETPV
jgi:hypothetical protein